MRLWRQCVGIGVLIVSMPFVAGQSAPPPSDSQTVLTTMLAHESADAWHRRRYGYMSEERSDRTGGHVWTERVVETELGRVRFLLMEDGRALTAARASAECARLADIAAHPDAFQKREQAQHNDELHAKELLQLLPKAFLFDKATAEGAYLRIHFRPNPAYVPQSLEERVLHGMVGSFVVETKSVRLRGIEGRLPEDVSFGFGLLATVKAGSNFSMTRDQVEGDDWKTTVLDTDINGRAIFFKALARKQHSVHGDFRRLPEELAFAKAVELAEDGR